MTHTNTSVASDGGWYPASAGRNTHYPSLGIGCLDGAVLTPHGVYSITQVFGPQSFESAPERQFVVPFRRDANTKLPEVGDDVRWVLSNHLPLLSDNSKSNAELGLEAQSVHRLLLKFRDRIDESLPNVVLIPDPDQWIREIHVVVFNKDTVIEVTPSTEYRLMDSETSLQDSLRAAYQGTTTVSLRSFGSFAMQEVQRDLVMRHLKKRAAPGSKQKVKKV